MRESSTTSFLAAAVAAIAMAVEAAPPSTSANESREATAATSPAAPTGLEARVYSATAGEILWARPATFGLVYDVSRDGRKLVTTDGTSYFDVALSAGRSYLYEVVAIDRAGQRSAASSVTLTTPGAAAAGPAAPTGLRAVAYSGTAGGIAWARPAATGLRYEVRRDGTVVATSAATSYVDEALAAGRTYVYEVVAIDRAGRRSVASSVMLTAPSGSGDTPPMLAAPTGLEARVYSATAGEILWRRPATFGLVYDVVRDGLTLATTDGTSWFDDTLSAGRSYLYEIVAIDRQGVRSVASSVTLTTPGGGSDGSAAVLNLDNQLDIVTRVLGLYVGKGYDEAILTGRDFIADNAPVSEEDLEPGGDVRRFGYNCPEGGTASVTQVILSAGLVQSLDQRYTDCGWRGRVRDGAVSYSSEPYGRLGWGYDGFVLRDEAGREVRVDGSIARSYNFSKALFYDERRNALSRYSAEDEAGTTLLSDVDTTFGYGETDVGADGLEKSAFLAGSFEVSAPWSGDAPLAVTTPEPFVDASGASRRFPSGRLEIRAGDGNALVLDTDDGDGDVNTVALRLTIDGETETQVETWERWLDVLTFDDTDGD